MNLEKEIHNFKHNQKTNISPEMFVLWEYKMSKTDYSRKSLFNILQSDNVHMKLNDHSTIKSLKLIDADEFYFMLSLYKKNNMKLLKFVNRMIKE